MRLVSVWVYHRAQSISHTTPDAAPHTQNIRSKLYTRSVYCAAHNVYCIEHNARYAGLLCVRRKDEGWGRTLYFHSAHRQSESVILISVNLLFLLSFYKGATEPISLDISSHCPCYVYMRVRLATLEGYSHNVRVFVLLLSPKYICCATLWVIIGANISTNTHPKIKWWKSFWMPISSLYISIYIFT